MSLGLQMPVKSGYKICVIQVFETLECTVLE